MWTLPRVAVTLVLLAISGTALSGATYTAQRVNSNNGLTTAADFGVHVAVTDPGSPLRGTVNIGATASQTAGGSISNVVIERSPAGAGTWTAICTDNATPYSCSLNTTTVSDGLYDFRARATDNGGYTRTSQSVANRRIDNTAPTVTTGDPGAWFGGTITLTSTTSDGSGSGVASVRYEYKTSAGSTWTTACTGNTAPFSCSFSTTGLTNGTAYDFRAVATDVATNSATSTAITNRQADNQAPAAGALTDPGSPLRGTITLNASASDALSGIALVRVQYAPANTTNWSTACTDNAAPYSCAWNTATVADGTYDMRIQSVDVAGNTSNSAQRNDRVVDNTGPALTFTNPGAGPFRGDVVLAATATDTPGSGVLNVKFQRSPAGAGTWTDICTDTTSAYGCTWDSTLVADGSYDLRAVAADNAGNSTTSSVYSSRVIDNTPAFGLDVQTTDAGGTPGLLQVGDSITLTYSETMDPATIIAGWNGTGSQAITIRLNNNAANDRLLFWNAANSAQLALTGNNGVTLGADHVTANMVWSGYLTYSGSSVTATFTSITTGSLIGTPTGNATLTWAPDKNVRDFAGNDTSNTVRTEGGAADPNF